MFGLVLCVALLVCAPVPAWAQGLPALQDDLDALVARVQALETLLQGVSNDGTDALGCAQFPTSLDIGFSLNPCPRKPGALYFLP